MKSFNFFLIFLFLVQVVPSNLYSQDLKENEVVEINGKKMILHKVRSGETIYSICKKYQVSNNQFNELNPELRGGLKVGELIKIPYTGQIILSSSENQHKRKPDNFMNHEIKRKETPYFISKKYDITIEDIYEYNPGLKKFSKGKIIKIPQWTGNPYETQQNVADNKDEERKVQFFNYTVQKGETLYSLSKRFNLTIPEILHYNPEARNLREGSELKLPENRESPVDNTSKDSGSEEGIQFHIIESGETLYGLTKKYNVSKEELVELNPVLKKNFPAGEVIKIPLKTHGIYSDSSEAGDVSGLGLKKHVVKKGETLYSLAESYGVETNDIKKYNQALNYRELVSGETLFIPQPVSGAKSVSERIDYSISSLTKSDIKKNGPVIEVPVDCQSGPGAGRFGKTIRIAMFLPLYINENEDIYMHREDEFIATDSQMILKLQDTLIETGRQREAAGEFFRNSENFVCFYEGALLALDSLMKSGIRISLTVYDTRQDINIIRKIIAEEKLKETNLIIGPVYPEQQADLAAFSAKNRIPIVSPLSPTSECINSNPYYFQVNPSRDYINLKTAELIATDYFKSNLIILDTGSAEKTPEIEMVELIREKMTNASYYSNLEKVNFQLFDFNKKNIEGLPVILSKEMENVVFIASIKEGDISEILSNLNHLVTDYNITIIGSNRYPQLKSIEQEHYHNLKLKYYSPYFVDYNSINTKNLIKKYRNIFKSEPAEYGFQGFDVTYFFGSLLGNYGKDFYNCLPYINGDMTQGSYHFERVNEMGGYMNKGLSLVSYESDYTVTRKEIIGQPILVSDK